MPDVLMKYNPAFLTDEELIDSFVIRSREFGAVMEVVHENTGPSMQHVLVIGPRGSGKTTLGHRVAAEIRHTPDLDAAWYPVIFAEESYGVTSPGEFWLEALLRIAEQTGDCRWRETHAELSREMDPDHLNRRALAQMRDFAEEAGKRLVLFVENLHMIVGNQLTEDHAWTLREALMNESRIMLLGTATQRFGAIENERQALYNQFRLLTLDPIDDLDDMEALWHLASDEIIPRGHLRAIEILTGGNPRLIRILNEFAAQTSFQELTDNLVRLVDDHTDYLKHHFDVLAPQERKVFAALAERWDPGTTADIAAMTRMPTNQVSVHLRRLEIKGAVSIRTQRGRTKVYQVAERLYNIYYLMRRRGEASARVRAAVRFMVQLYQGDALIPVVQSLVDEACGLTSAQRRDHYLAFQEVLSLTEPTLRTRIIEATRDRMKALPDVPKDIYAHFAQTESNPYADLTVNELLAIEVAKLSDADDAKRLLSKLVQVAIGGEHKGFDRALEVADHMHSQVPNDSYIFAWQGIAFQGLKRYNEALVAFDRSIDLNLDDYSVHFCRAGTLANLDRYDEALDAYDRAIELQPEEASFHYNRGRVLMDLQRYDDALNAYDRAIELKPDRCTSHASRGLVLELLGRYNDAISSYNRALEIVETTPPYVHTGKIRSFALLGNFKAALELIDPILTNKDLLCCLPCLVNTCVIIAAGRQSAALLELILSKPNADDIEPLIVALRLDIGEEVEVAQEIEEMARDIVRQIEAKRARKAEADA